MIVTGNPILAQAPGPNGDTNPSYVSELLQQFPKIETQEQKDWVAYLYSIATKEEADTLFRIALCESGWKNVPNYLYTGEEGKFTAFGPFQILKSTAARYSPGDRRDPYLNIWIAVQLYRSRGASPWICPWR